MNIFYLDPDVNKCAQYHCDKHVCKMIVEYAQILSTVSHMSGKHQGYKPTHESHPCVGWARLSVNHWIYLRCLAIKLCHEYTHRYGKVHKTQKIIESLLLPNLPSVTFLNPPKCMPDQYKVEDTVESYRNYYIMAKGHFAKWKNREVPSWFKVEILV